MLGNDDSILERRKAQAELDRDVRDRDVDAPVRSDAGEGSILERKIGRTAPPEAPVEPLRPVAPLAADDAVDNRLRREARTGPPPSVLEPHRRRILESRKTRAAQEERYREEGLPPRRRASFASRF